MSARPASRALIFVSGWGAHGSEWLTTPLWKGAAAAGWTVHRLSGRTTGESIDDSSQRLVELVGTLRSDHDQVAVVGHSLGGLVAERADLVDRMDAIVTIATPHRGIWGALLLGWTDMALARDMVPGSSFLMALRSAPGPRSPLLAIAVRSDIVVPGNASVPTRAHDALAFAGSHLDVIYRQELADAVFGWLATNDVGPKLSDNGYRSTTSPASDQPIHKCQLADDARG